MSKEDYVVEKTWTSENGHLCVVLAMKRGFRSGYVGIKENNSLHGKHYHDEETNGLYVHGGITFSEYNEIGYPVDIQERLWFFGFDCAHCDDGVDESILSKEHYHLRSCLSGVPKTLDYCISECEELSKQLREFESNILEIKIIERL